VEFFSTSFKTLIDARHCSPVSVNRPESPLRKLVSISRELRFPWGRTASNPAKLSSPKESRSGMFFEELLALRLIRQQIAMPIPQLSFSSSPSSPPSPLASFSLFESGSPGLAQIVSACRHSVGLSIPAFHNSPRETTSKFRPLGTTVQAISSVGKDAGPRGIKCY